MLISSDAIIENVAWVLEHEIAPAVEDQAWLASYLRSIRGLLQFIGAHAQMEGPILHDDNVDLRALLRRLADSHYNEEIADVLAKYGSAQDGFVGAESLREENRAYREALDRTIPVLHDPPVSPLLEEVREYLKRSVEREAPMYAAMTGPPF